MLWFFDCFYFFWKLVFMIIGKCQVHSQSLAFGKRWANNLAQARYSYAIFIFRNTPQVLLGHQGHGRNPQGGRLGQKTEIMISHFSIKKPHSSCGCSRHSPVFPGTTTGRHLAWSQEAMGKRPLLCYPNLDLIRCWANPIRIRWSSLATALNLYQILKVSRSHQRLSQPSSLPPSHQLCYQLGWVEELRCLHLTDLAVAYPSSRYTSLKATLHWQ